MVSLTKRPSDREQFWRRVICEQQQSGISIKAFCQSRGISQPSYFAWRKKLALCRPTNTQPGFVAVRVAPDTPVQSSGIEIVLDRGRRVRVEPGFDRQLLGDVLTVLEERPC